MMFKDGVLMTLNVTKWSGAKKLEPADLGLNPDEIPDFMRLGRKVLIPDYEKNVFVQDENNARNFLERWSFPFPVGGARFVPRKQLINVIQGLEEFKATYSGAVKSFVDRYDQIRGEMLLRYASYAEKLEPYYPPKSSVENKFSFNWVVFEITDSRIGEADAADVIEAYERFKRDLQQKFDSFLEEVAQDMRGTVTETLNHLAQRIGAGEVITAASVKSVKSMIDRFQGLNFLGDESIDAKLSEMRNILNHQEPKEAAAQIMEDDTLRARLGDMARSIAAEAANIGDVSRITGEYKRSLMIDDN